MQLQGNTFIVTGGASGLGAATARMIVTGKGNVVIADLSERQGNELAAELGASARFVRTDVADEASAKEKAKCASLPTEMKTPPNFADRFNQREERMKTRLESLEAVKPSLMALYAALTPEQRAILDRPMMGHHRGRG